MEPTATGYRTIDEYIAQYPDDVRARLEAMRAAIRAAAPEAQETISYQMPAFALNGVLVYFAAWKQHVGFYPTGGGVEAFRDELAEYANAKGSVRFPNDQPLPLDLIGRIVRFRVEENLAKAARSQKRKAQ